MGGGLNGTGVPFTRKKWKTDHRAKKLPTLRIGSEINTFQGLGRSWGSESFASMSREKMRPCFVLFQFLLNTGSHQEEK